MTASRISAIGAPNLASDDSGGVYVYLGSATGSPRGMSMPLSIIGIGPSSHIGAVLANVGDLNGDGCSDLGVGTGSSLEIYSGGAGGELHPIHGSQLAEGSRRRRRERRSATVIRASSPDASSGSGTALLDLGGSGSPSSTAVTSSFSVQAFGYSIAGAGDTDGDGFGDFLVGSPTAMGGSTMGYVGAVFFYRGATGGISSSSPDAIAPPYLNAGSVLLVASARELLPLIRVQPAADKTSQRG